ncbi:non-oxidative hydroxyarylic acid decarboxylases subunit D [Streptomyces sp. NPDC056580]|uniref:non-oxidative hydroxyarylic acid decarboxylases subunit D n=1 Tax=Streptomyces sp. NPDC056580 TaxID=3345872 RepID=UPI003684FD77
MTNTSVCPRCDTDTVRVLTTSPVPDRWVMYVCSTCIYSWRSTEPTQATDPATYPAAFKIDPADIPALAAIPPVPPRRQA